MKAVSLTGKILETVIGLTVTSAELFAVIATSGYGASYGQMRRKLEGVPERNPKRAHSENLIKRRRSFYAMLYRLRKDGLVERRQGKWIITRAGRGRYKKILSRLPLNRYKKEVDTTLKIIIFDIPEKEKEKRFWLRDRLRELGFRMLQKSVWAGKVKVPEEFLDSLRDLEALDYVEIFAISKAGSLRSLS